VPPATALALLGKTGCITTTGADFETKNKRKTRERSPRIFTVPLIVLYTFYVALAQQQTKQNYNTKRTAKIFSKKMSFGKSFGESLLEVIKNLGALLYSPKKLKSIAPASCDENSNNVVNTNEDSKPSNNNTPSTPTAEIKPKFSSPPSTPLSIAKFENFEIDYEESMMYSTSNIEHEFKHEMIEKKKSSFHCSAFRCQRIDSYLQGKCEEIVEEEDSASSDFSNVHSPRNQSKSLVHLRNTPHLTNTPKAFSSWSVNVQVSRNISNNYNGIGASLTIPQYGQNNKKSLRNDEDLPVITTTRPKEKSSKRINNNALEYERVLGPGVSGSDREAVELLRHMQTYCFGSQNDAYSIYTSTDYLADADFYVKNYGAMKVVAANDTSNAGNTRSRSRNFYTATAY